MTLRLSFRTMIEWVAIVALLSAVVVESSRERFVLALVAPVPLALGFRWLSFPTAVALCRALVAAVWVSTAGVVAMFLVALAGDPMALGGRVLWNLGGATAVLALLLWLATGAAVGFAQYHEWWNEGRERAWARRRAKAHGRTDGRIDAPGL
jgi:hypothetical protein